jgi:hypothetical protein
VRWAVLALVLGLGCAAPTAPIEPPPLPVITSLTPRTGLAGEEYWVDIVLVGRRFARVDNVVRVMPHPRTVAPHVTVSGLASDRNGTRISFELPKCVRYEGGPCFLLGIGNYDVTVTTAAGESNVAPFTLCTPWLSTERCLMWGGSP